MNPRPGGARGRFPAVPHTAGKEHPLAEPRRVTWKRRTITVLIRPSVQRWSSQPWAADPSARSRSSVVNRSSLSRGSDAGPLEFRACEPPGAQARLQRRTERTLARSSLATAAFVSPRANRSAASSPDRSRNSRRSAVSPPPCGYRTPRRYRTERPPASRTRHHEFSLSSKSLRLGRHAPMRRMSASWAFGVASAELAVPLPRRWAHTQGVTARATALGSLIQASELLICAATLHDVGYAPRLATTGFHPLDGARFLRDEHHADERLTRLVANHSFALLEAVLTARESTTAHRPRQLRSSQRRSRTSPRHRLAGGGTAGWRWPVGPTRAG